MHGLMLTPRPLPMRRYILLMALISLLPSLLLSSLLYATGIMTDANGPQFDSEPFGSPFMLFIAVVFISPVIETLLLSLGIRLFSLWIKTPWRVALASAIAWAVLHSLAAPAWGLIICWPFFVFSCAYLTWRRQSWLNAYGAACCIHVLQNLLPGLILLVQL
jgi:hypothetical protein